MTWPGALGVALALYVGWAALLFVLQRSMMFPGAAGDSSPAPPARGFEVWTVAAAGCEVEAWYYAPAPEGKPCPAMIFAHGNGELLDDWYGAFRPLAEEGIAVLLVEFPGYGRSRGKPSQASVVATLRVAYDRLASLSEVDGGRIVGVGRSLGGGGICALSRERALAGLVLMSTFTSARWYARRFFLPGFLVRDPFDNRLAVSRFEGPVLIIHGKRDATVPYEHGEALSHAAPDAELIVYDVGHSDCPPEWDAFLERLGGFIRSAPSAGLEER